MNIAEAIQLMTLLFQRHANRLNEVAIRTASGRTAIIWETDDGRHFQATTPELFVRAQLECWPDRQPARLPTQET